MAVVDIRKGKSKDFKGIAIAFVSVASLVAILVIFLVTKRKRSHRHSEKETEIQTEVVKENAEII